MSNDYYRRLFLLFFVVVVVHSTTAQEASRIVHQTLAPSVWRYRTGRLDQFVGFVTPRPLPSNAQFLYSSVWAAWSAWSFCVDNARIRVRACNTVRGFSCLGTNREQKSCDESRDGRLPAVLAPQDYDAIDPWVADRKEAMSQLYPDDHVDAVEQSPTPSILTTKPTAHKEETIKKKTTLVPPPPLARVHAAPIVRVADDTFESSGTQASTDDEVKQISTKQLRSPIPPASIAATGGGYGGFGDNDRQFASNLYHPPGLTPELLAKLKEKTERTAAFAARLVSTDEQKSSIKNVKTTKLEATLTNKTTSSTTKEAKSTKLTTTLTQPPSTKSSSTSTATELLTTTTTSSSSSSPSSSLSPPRAKQAPSIANITTELEKTNTTSEQKPKIVLVDGQAYEVVTSDGGLRSNSNSGETASIIVHKVNPANQIPLQLLGEAMSHISETLTTDEAVTDASIDVSATRTTGNDGSAYDEEYIYVDYGNATDYDDETTTKTTETHLKKKKTMKPLISGEIIAVEKDRNNITESSLLIETVSKTRHYGKIITPRLIASRLLTPRERAQQSSEMLISSTSRRISGDIYPPLQGTDERSKHSGEVVATEDRRSSTKLSGDTVVAFAASTDKQVSGEVTADSKLLIIGDGNDTNQALTAFAAKSIESHEISDDEEKSGEIGAKIKLKHSGEVSTNVDSSSSSSLSIGRVDGGEQQMQMLMEPNNSTTHIDEIKIGGKEKKTSVGNTSSSQSKLDDDAEHKVERLAVIQPPSIEEKTQQQLLVPINNNAADIRANFESSIVHEMAIGDAENIQRFAESAQWSDWGDWSECKCNRQSRSRVCDYEIAYLTRGCIGRSYETRSCEHSTPCSTSVVPTTTTATESTTSALFYTLAPQKGVFRRTGYAFQPHPLTIARSANANDTDTR